MLERLNPIADVLIPAGCSSSPGDASHANVQAASQCEWFQATRLIEELTDGEPTQAWSQVAGTQAFQLGNLS